MERFALYLSVGERREMGGVCYVSVFVSVFVFGCVVFRFDGLAVWFGVEDAGENDVKKENMEEENEESSFAELEHI